MSQRSRGETPYAVALRREVAMKSSSCELGEVPLDADLGPP